MATKKASTKKVVTKKSVAKKPAAKTATKIVPADIIKRGYVFEEEYDLMLKSKKMNKLSVRDTDGQSEGIWVYPLEEDNKAGSDFHFVFFNDPLMMLGAPRPVAGLVGIARSAGKDNRATADILMCWELFKKSGQESIDYHRSICKKENVNAS